jgi:hypothetical protein
MAENTQTFILVGDFKDNITPSLAKLDRQLNSLTKSFEKLSSKLRPISKEFGNMAGAAERMADALKNQRGAFDSNVRAMQQYRREAGKVKAANDALARSGGRGGRGGGVPPGGLPPGGLPPAGRGRGGRDSFAAAAGGFVAGEGLANMMTGAIVRGFQMGTNIMMKPFRYGANAIGERIKDEMSDISSAGGMFAVDKRDKLGVFKSFDDARNFQEQLNARLAKSAAALPGETAEYVQQAKMMTDSMMIAFGKNKEGFMKFAKELDSTVTNDRDALGLVTQKFTEKAVLLGKGSGGSSAYGVPQILEMLVSQEKVNVQAFRRFSAYQSNPLLKNSLEAAEAELKKTGANSAERLRVIQKVLDQAVPNDVVMAMQNSADGIYQAVKSAFLDPEAGLLGFGRKLDKIKVAARDSLGRFVNDAGEVVETAAQAAQQSASLFGLLRDIVGGFVLPLTGLTDILPQLYDPLAGIADQLTGFRNVAQDFYKNFNAYTSWFEQYSADLDKEGNKKKGTMIRESKKARGALASINNLLAAFGAIDDSEFKKNADALKNVDTSKLGEMAKTMFGQLFDSDFMKGLGEMIGSVVGSTIKAVGDFMAGVNDLASAGPFAKGLRAGFQKAKGAQGISLIFSNLFGLIGKALLTLFQSAPMEMGILTALTVGLPVLQGAITQGMIKMFSMAAAGMGLGGAAGAGGMGATIAGWLGAVGPALATVAKLLPPVAAILAAIVFLGGGVENTMRQLKQIFGEIGHTLWGSISGLSDVFGTVFGFIGDLATGIGRLINIIPGVGVQLDLLKVAFTPITAALQAFELGILGLNVLLTKVRSWLTNWLGSDEEKKARYEESVAADIKMRQTQGRQNAYNVSMQGPDALKKAMSSAIYELNNSKVLKASRSAELKAFVAEAKAQLGKPTPAAPPKPGAPKPAGSVPAAGGAPAAPTQVTIPPQSLAPITTATNTVNTTMTTVNSSTQGVRGAVSAADTAAKAAAAKHTAQYTQLLNVMNAVKSGIIAVSTKISGLKTSIDQRATQASLAQVVALMQSGKMKVQADFNMPGGPLGGGQGGPAIFGAAASKFGLTMTSGYRPGDPGYHGINRARDYSNGNAPTPQMMMFAQYLANNFGSGLKELIYTPLGWSIKDGRKVPAYARAGHYDHVHVAWAGGIKNPRFFDSAAAARQYESMYAPAGARIQTATWNSAEGRLGGGPTTVNQNITISGADDPRRLAEIVFNYAAQAAERINNSSFA